MPSSFTELGDVTTGVTWRLWRHERARISGRGDIRWPTGESDSLIAVGNVVPRAELMASFGGADALRVNATLSFAKGRGGARFGQFTALPFSGPIVTRAAALDQWAYGVSGQGAVHPRVTIGANVLLRTLLDAVGYDRGNVRSAGAVQTRSRLIPRPEVLTIGSAGFHAAFNVFRSVVATLSVAIPITPDAGLQPGLTPMLGLRLGL